MFKYITIGDAINKLQHRTLKPTELLEYCIEKIDKFEHLIQAWVHVDREGAFNAARKLEKEVNEGKIRGLLHGIPFGIKDIIDVKNLPTRAGSPLREGHKAGKDAAVVSRLREAGAIILGKTVTTEFASCDPPPTHNPWDINYSPGGSSSGSAASVSMGMCLGAVGTQTGGSITRPASYCGIASYKPTFGMISLDGVIPVSTHLDHVGFLAQNVLDIAIIMTALGIGDIVKPGYTTQSCPGYLFHLTDIKPPRIGINNDFFMSKAEKAVYQCTCISLKKLQNCGGKLVEVVLPGSFSEVHKMMRRIMAVGMAKYHEKEYRYQKEKFGKKVAARIEEGLGISNEDYKAALEHQLQFRKDILTVMKNIDVLLTPATDDTAPKDLNSTGSAKFNSPWSYAGLPTVSIPCGLADNGMPLGLQFIGHPFSETKLLVSALWCHRIIGFDKSPPILMCRT